MGLGKDTGSTRINRYEQQASAISFDSLIAVAQALDGQTSLGGLVDYLHIETPDFLSETVEGAPTIKAAVVPVILEYSTSNPLN